MLGLTGEPCSRFGQEGRNLNPQLHRPNTTAQSPNGFQYIRHIWDFCAVGGRRDKLSIFMSLLRTG